MTDKQKLEEAISKVQRADIQKQLLEEKFKKEKDQLDSYINQKDFQDGCIMFGGLSEIQLSDMVQAYFNNDMEKVKTYIPIMRDHIRAQVNEIERICSNI